MRVLIVTGSSGGHIFPALALLEELKNSGQELLLVLPKKSRDNHIALGSVSVAYISTDNLGLSWNRRNILSANAFLRGALESLRIVIRFRPEIVVGFGSSSTVALVFWAWLFRRKTIIHEQNVIPGRANRLLAKLVDRIAVSFEQTKNYLNVAAEKIVLTGNPLRKDLICIPRTEALDFFNFKAGKFNILITGGSQGSHKLNLSCFEALMACPKKDNLQVIHISGINDYELLKEKYASAGLSYKVFDFFSPMQYAYSAADLIISRSGATTIAELERFRIPAVLVPYPFAYAHQETNARILEEIKAALIIKDEELTAEKITAQINAFLENPQISKTMRQAYRLIKVLDATTLLAQEVLR